MAIQNVVTNAPKVKRSISVSFDFGADLKESTAKFTEQVVFSNWEDNAIIALQGRVRQMMEKGKTDAEIHEFVKAWKPGMRTRITVDPIQVHLANFESKSAAEQKAEIDKLMAIMNKKK